MQDSPDSSLVEVDTDPDRLDHHMIHQHLCHHSHWARGLPYHVFQRSLQHSLCFGAYLKEGGAQVGFARVISDQATFAYLADVFVLPAYQKKGICSQMITAVNGHPQLQGVRRFLLVSTHAQDFYARHGFSKVSHPERLMERLDYQLYRQT